MYNLPRSINILNKKYVKIIEISILE